MTHPAAPCRDRLLGQVVSESLSIDATDTTAFWVEFNWGTLQRRPLDGGEATTLVRHQGENFSEGLIARDDYVYWNSRGEHAVFRIAATGGAPERWIAIAADDVPEHIALVDDVLYVSTLSKLQWRRDRATGALPLEGGVALTSYHGALYIGGHGGIQRLASPTSKLETVVESDDRVSSLIVSDNTLFWAAGDAEQNLYRRALAGGEPAWIAETEAGHIVAFAAAPGGAYAGTSNGLAVLANRCLSP